MKTFLFVFLVICSANLVAEEAPSIMSGTATTPPSLFDFNLRGSTFQVKPSSPEMNSYWSTLNNQTSIVDPRENRPAGCTCKISPKACPPVPAVPPTATGLPSCSQLQANYKKCSQGNPRYCDYSDMCYDCEDYAHYCATLMTGVTVFSYWCCDGSKKSGHGVNRVKCDDSGVAKICIYEPQSGNPITCWPASAGDNPPGGYNQSQLCAHIDMPNGKICKMVDTPSGEDPNDDPAPRTCSEKNSSYSSCRDCCLTTANADGRPNIDWLNRCNYFCWGLPGTPPGPVPIPKPL